MLLSFEFSLRSSSKSSSKTIESCLDGWFDALNAENEEAERVEDAKIDLPTIGITQARCSERRSLLGLKRN